MIPALSSASRPAAPMCRNRAGPRGVPPYHLVTATAPRASVLSRRERSTRPAPDSPSSSWPVVSFEDLLIASFSFLLLVELEVEV